MINALKITLRSRRMLGLMYGTSLVLGLLAALPMYANLKTLDGNSLAFLNLLPGFDYTVYEDFMHNNGKAISPLLGVGRWIGILYLFLSVFFTGGILLQFTQPSAPLRAGTFWQGASHYVGRYMRLLSVTLLFVLATFGIPFIVSILLAVAVEGSFTERGWFFIGFAGFIVGFVLATLVLCISDYAKVILFREDERSAFRAFGQAGRLVLRNLPATYGRYWLLILTGTGLFGIYFLLDSLIGMYNWPTIILMLIVQQFFIFSRIALKVWNLGVVYEMYGRLPKPALRIRPVAVPPVINDLEDNIGAEENPAVNGPTDTAIGPLTDTLVEEKPTDENRPQIVGPEPEREHPSD